MRIHSFTTELCFTNNSNYNGNEEEEQDEIGRTSESINIINAASFETYSMTPQDAFKLPFQRSLI